jgi:hypothetical protein
MTRPVPGWAWAAPARTFRGGVSNVRHAEPRTRLGGSVRCRARRYRSGRVRTGSRSPGSYISRSSDVFAAGGRHDRLHSVRCLRRWAVAGRAGADRDARASCRAGAQRGLARRPAPCTRRPGSGLGPAWPGGDAAVAFLEAGDFAAFAMLEVSAEPSGRWFRGRAAGGSPVVAETRQSWSHDHS